MSELIVPILYLVIFVLLLGFLRVHKMATRNEFKTQSLEDRLGVANQRITILHDRVTALEQRLRQTDLPEERYGIKRLST